MRSMIVMLGSALLISCSSVTPVSRSGQVLNYGKGCSVTVYQTEAAALKGGEIEELCVISGTSSGSFKHTPDTAIQKHAKKACECGANKVYIESRSPAGMTVAKTSMVAFKYVKE